MKFKKEKTNRGFKKFLFEDDYNLKCSLQESSSVEPHIWLGVDKVEAVIQFCDSERLGLGLKKQHEECNEFGWCDYPIPEEVLLKSRMHLNRKQARELALKLLEFSFNGEL